MNIVCTNEIINKTVDDCQLIYDINNCFDDEHDDDDLNDTTPLIRKHITNPSILFGINIINNYL